MKIIPAMLHSLLCVSLVIASNVSLAEQPSPSSRPNPSLIALTDDELSDTKGQALFNLSYLAPNQAGNFESLSNIGFYRLGLEAELELNANIRKLQLGCGGVNGTGGCDIDIDNLSLSGFGTTRDGRVDSSAKFTNPFMEFAIKNPNSASTREIVGYRVSAERAQGLLTAGLENGLVPNGINSLSGFVRVQSDESGYIYGKAQTGARFLDARANAPYTINGIDQNLNNEITAKVQVAGLSAIGLGGLATINIKTIGGGLTVPAMQNIPFIRSGVVVNGNRINSLPLQATLNVPTIRADWRGVYPVGGQVATHNPVESPIDWNFAVPLEVRVPGGPLEAEVLGCQGLGCILLPAVGINTGDVLRNVFLKGVINGISADVTINQGLGYIHKLPINSAAYLSLQSQAVRWPGTYSGSDPANPSQTVTDVAQRGWWLSLADPVNLGSVDPVEPIDIAPLFPQIALQASNYLNSNPVTIGTSGLLNAIAGTGDINVTVAAPINLSANPLALTLNDLQLGGQEFATNCRGTLTYC